MKLALALVAFVALVMPAAAQFAGPSAGGAVSTVAEAKQVRIGTYVTLVGNVIEHQRGNYYTFADATGQMRAEIRSSIWAGRAVTPSTTVRLRAEVDRGFRGRYLWVEALEVVE